MPHIFVKMDFSYTRKKSDQSIEAKIAEIDDQNNGRAVAFSIELAGPDWTPDYEGASLKEGEGYLFFIGKNDLVEGDLSISLTEDGSVNYDVDGIFRISAKPDCVAGAISGSHFWKFRAEMIPIRGITHITFIESPNTQWEKPVSYHRLNAVADRSLKGLKGKLRP